MTKKLVRRAVSFLIGCSLLLGSLGQKQVMASLPVTNYLATVTGVDSVNETIAAQTTFFYDEWGSGEWEPHVSTLNAAIPNPDALSVISAGDQLEVSCTGSLGQCWAYVAMAPLSPITPTEATALFGDPLYLLSGLLDGHRIEYEHTPDCSACDGHCEVAYTNVDVLRQGTAVDTHQLAPGDSFSYQSPGIQIEIFFHEGQVSRTECGLPALFGPQPFSDFTVSVSQDASAPAAVTDLRVVPADGSREARLWWTAPGDDGHEGGAATEYEIRRSSSPITPANWSSCASVPVTTVPGFPTSPESQLVSELPLGTRQYFALKTVDDAGNTSELSNVPSFLDTGYRPDPDGYGILNGDGRWGQYPAPPADGDFTIAHMRDMFGDTAVCHIAIGSICVPRLGAVAWNEVANYAMTGGHCGGMSATSARFFEDLDALSDFGNETTHGLDFDSFNAVINRTVRQHISYYSAKQFIAPLGAHIVGAVLSTPKGVLSQLQSRMAGTMPDPPILYIWKDTLDVSRAHVLNPYAIEEQGNSQWRIWVYDSNHNAFGWQWVTINTSQDTWSYKTGAWDWSGDDASHTLGVVPLSEFAETPYCVWCPAIVAAADASVGQIWLSGKGHLLITDSHGRRIGYAGEQFVNEIPGAYAGAVPGGLDKDLEPIYNLPLDGDHSVVLDGRTLTEPTRVAIAQFGPGHSASADQVTLGPSSNDRLVFAADGTGLRYETHEPKEVSLTITLENADESRRLRIVGADLAPGDTVKAEAHQAMGEFLFDNGDGKGGYYDLELGIANPAGTRRFSHHDVAISRGDTHRAAYGEWTGLGAVTLYIDRGSDGSIDETLALENQLFEIYLPLLLRHR